ncbi:MAG: hypothetical protein ABI477_08680, partial [Chryseolinea sp.]
ESEFIVVLVLAHRFVGKNPRSNDCENEKKNHDVERPPVQAHILYHLKFVKIGPISLFIAQRIKNCLA